MKKMNSNKRVNWNTMFHVVITMNNGFHKTLRVSRRMVAHIATKFRECKDDIFHRFAEIDVYGEKIVLNVIKEIKFVYENTHTEFLTLS